MRSARSFITVAACLAIFVVAFAAPVQSPVVDMVADKVIQKYQNASCQQLAQERAQPKNPTPEEANAVRVLHEDAQIRAQFINKVAAPVVNKLFECGLIP